MILSFKEWFRSFGKPRKAVEAPAADRVVQLIAASQGMTRGQLASAIPALPHPLLAELLDGLHNAGVIQALPGPDGEPIFRAR
jgi:hypothetical protein